MRTDGQEGFQRPDGSEGIAQVADIHDQPAEQNRTHKSGRDPDNEVFTVKLGYVRMKHSIHQRIEIAHEEDNHGEEREVNAGAHADPSQVVPARLAHVRPRP